MPSTLPQTGGSGDAPPGGELDRHPATGDSVCALSAAADVPQAGLYSWQSLRRVRRQDGHHRPVVMRRARIPRHHSEAARSGCRGQAPRHGSIPSSRRRKPAYRRTFVLPQDRGRAFKDSR